MTMDPPAPRVLSFRHLLTEAVAEFLADRGMPGADLAEALAEIIISLSRFREEGAPLYPQVYLTSDLPAMLATFHGQEPIPIHRGPRSLETVRRALKQCAPLAQGGWMIFFVIEPAALIYGVFLTLPFILADTPVEILRTRSNALPPIVGVLQLADNIIELRASAEACRYIYLSGARVDTPPPSRVLEEMQDVLTRDVPGSEPCLRLVRRFFRRVLLQVMQAPHGALVAVVPAAAPPSALLRDGIALDPPLDIAASVNAYLSEPGRETMAAVQSWASLLQGMLGADGITVLSTDGCVLGYNAFVHVHQAEEPAGALAPQSPIGGARRRSYNVLCRLLGSELVAAFYRSQDGNVECCVA